MTVVLLRMVFWMLQPLHAFPAQVEFRSDALLGSFAGYLPVLLQPATRPPR